MMKILVVEDNEGDYFLVHEYLHESFPNIEITHNALLKEAIGSLTNANFDIILLDLSLPDSNGIDSIVDMIKLAKDIPVIVLTGFGNLQFAIDSLKLGVQDYLLKDDVNPLVLQKSIGYSIERNKIRNSMRISDVHGLDENRRCPDSRNRWQAAREGVELADGPAELLRRDRRTCDACGGLD